MMEIKDMTNNIQETRMDRIEKSLQEFIREFSKGMLELKASQKKTDAQILELKASQKKTDEQLNRTDEQLNRTDEQLKKTIKKLDDIGVNLGEMGIVQGEVAEELFLSFQDLVAGVPGQQDTGGNRGFGGKG